MLVEDTNEAKNEGGRDDDEGGEAAGDAQVHHSSPAGGEEFVFVRKYSVFMADAFFSNPR